MPTKKSAFSLRKFCLLSITKNFDNVWCPMDAKKIYEVEDWSIQGQGPFPDLPPGILEDLIETMKDERLLRRHHLHYLFCSNLENVSLSNGIGDIYFALQFLSDRCQNLRNLDMSYQRQISPPALTRMVRSLPSIRVLNLQHTLCVDTTLACIGSTCPHLMSLNLTGCPVSDRGMVGLCLNFRTQMPQCRHLTRLNVAETNVTSEGAAVALYYLPYLQDFDMLFDAVDELQTRDFCNSELINKERARNVYNTIACFKSNSDDVTPQNLNAAVTMCPKVSHVCLRRVDLPNDSILTLSGLSNLSELILGNGFRMTLTFDEGILPLLTASGNQLVKLHLSDISDIDVDLIGLSCPALRDLAFTEIGEYRETSENNHVSQPLFTHLRYLLLHSADQADLPDRVVRQLTWHCPRLQELRVKRCSSLSDMLMMELMRCNPMTDLTYLHLEECNRVSAGALLGLLLADNTLETIRIWSCGDVTSKDYQQLMELVSANNLELNFDFVGCEQ